MHETPYAKKMRALPFRMKCVKNTQWIQYSTLKFRIRRIVIPDVKVWILCGSENMNNELRGPELFCRQTHICQNIWHTALCRELQLLFSFPRFVNELSGVRKNMPVKIMQISLNNSHTAYCKKKINCKMDCQHKINLNQLRTPKL